MNGIRPFGQTDEDVKVSGIKSKLNTLENNLEELKAALKSDDVIRQSNEADVTALEQILFEAANAIDIATKKFKAPFYVNLGEAYKRYLK